MLQQNELGLQDECLKATQQELEDAEKLMKQILELTLNANIFQVSNRKTLTNTITEIQPLHLLTLRISDFVYHLFQNSCPENI